MMLFPTSPLQNLADVGKGVTSARLMATQNPRVDTLHVFA